MAFDDLGVKVRYASRRSEQRQGNLEVEERNHSLVARWRIMIDSLADEIANPLKIGEGLWLWSMTWMRGGCSPKHQSTISQINEK